MGNAKTQNDSQGHYTQRHKTTAKNTGIRKDKKRQSRTWETHKITERHTKQSKAGRHTQTNKGAGIRKDMKTVKGKETHKDTQGNIPCFQKLSIEPI